MKYEEKKGRKRMKVLGIDLGNYTTTTNERISFISKVSNVSGIEETGDLMIFEGEKVYLGEGEFDTEFKKVNKQNLIKLLYGAIALSSDSKENCIVCGLPLSQYKEDKEELKNKILLNSSKDICINGVDKKIVITDIEVMPEGVVAVTPDYQGIVIDIGGRTTDICLIVKENGKRKIKQPYSLPKGMLNLENEYINVINSRFGLDLMGYDADRLLTNGLSIYGEHQDIRFAMQVYKDFVEQLVSRIQVDYPVKTYPVTVTGGGAELLYKPIKNRIPNVTKIEEAFYANARGYYEIGREIWR